MLKFQCLVLDHDDTVVQSEKTIGYPFFCQILNEFRPGQSISLEDYVSGCYHIGFAEMCRQYWNFTEDELDEEYNRWLAYVRTHIPDPYPGIAQIIHKQKELGGLVCVVSHSARENITRDYLTHFGIVPDDIYGWDLPEEQRKPSTYPLLDIMRKYELKPNELLVVDDLKLAYSMARGVGSPIAFAAWSKEDLPSLAQEMNSICDYSFQSTEALYCFLFG